MGNANQIPAEHSPSSPVSAFANPLYTCLLNLVNHADTQKALEHGFIEVARLLLLQSTLQVAGKAYQLVDVEFYFYNADFHPDPYSHSFQYANSVRSKQSVTGAWYFHRFTGIKKYTHTRRGIDLTYGDGEKHRFGGILIRAMKSLVDDRIITGPSRVVGEIITAIDNAQKLEEIAFDMHAGLAFDPQSSLFLAFIESARNIPLYSTSRFGISDKDPVYQQKHYRFFTASSMLKKMKDVKTEVS